MDGPEEPPNPLLQRIAFLDHVIRCGRMGIGWSMDFYELQLLRRERECLANKIFEESLIKLRRQKK
jgi:hypothetical protein